MTDASFSAADLKSGLGHQAECDANMGFSAYLSARMGRDGFAIRHFPALLKAVEERDTLRDRVGFLEARVADIRAVLPRVEALEAERDALAAEVEKLTTEIREVHGECISCGAFSGEDHDPGCDQ